MGKRTTYLLLLLVLGLGGYIAFVERGALSSAELDARRGQMLSRFVRARLSTLSFQRGDEPEVRLERVRDGEGELGLWKLTAPVSWPADEEALDSLLGAMEWANARRRLESVSRDDLSRFGLTSPRVTVNYRVADESRRIRVGGESPAGEVYVQLDDEPTVYLAGKDFFEALDRSVTDLRAKELMLGVAPRRTEEVRVTVAPQSALSTELAEAALSKGKTGWRLEGDNAGWASDGRVARLLDALDNVRVARFVDDAPDDAALEKFGLKSPALQIALSRKVLDDTMAATLSVGEPCADESVERPAPLLPERTDDEGDEAREDGASESVKRLVRLDDGPVVCVNGEFVQTLGRTRDDYRARGVLRVRPDEVEAFEITPGDALMPTNAHAGKLTFKRVDTGWTIEGLGVKPGTPADPDAVQALLTTLAAPVAEGILTDAKTGADGASFLALRAWLSAQEPEEAPAIEVRAPSSSEVVRKGESFGLRLPKGSLSAVRLQPFTYFDRQLTDDFEATLTELSMKLGVSEIRLVDDGEWQDNVDASAVRARLAAWLALPEAKADTNGADQAGSASRVAPAMDALRGLLTDLRATDFAGPALAQGSPLLRDAVEIEWQTEPAAPEHDDHGHDHGHDHDHGPAAQDEAAVRAYRLRLFKREGDAILAQLDDGPVARLPLSVLETLVTALAPVTK